MMMEKIDLIPELISDLEIFKDFKQAMVYIQDNKKSSSLINLSQSPVE